LVVVLQVNAPSNDARTKGTGPQSVLSDRRKAKKGRSTMQPSSHSASTSLPSASSTFPSSRPAEDKMYQAMTIAAILMLLGSLWVF
jgi:hypothetical protein